MTTRIARTLAALTFALPVNAHAQAFDVVDATISGVHAAFKGGKLTCRALVQAHLDRITAYDKAGPALNAVQNLNPRALAELPAVPQSQAVSRWALALPGIREYV